MSHPSKQKGYRFEVAIDRRLNDRGHPSRRVWGSNGEAVELHKDVDNVARLFGQVEFNIQAKARKKLPSYITPIEDVDAQMLKEDYGEPLVVMRMDKFLDLVDEIYGIGMIDGGTVG